MVIWVNFSHVPSPPLHHKLACAVHLGPTVLFNNTKQSPTAGQVLPVLSVLWAFLHFHNNSIKLDGENIPIAIFQAFILISLLSAFDWCIHKTFHNFTYTVQ